MNIGFSYKWDILLSECLSNETTSTPPLIWRGASKDEFVPPSEGDIVEMVS